MSEKTVTMSRELAEQFLAGGRQCDREQLRALLDAPSAPVDAEQWYADTPDGDSALVARVAALCNHPSMSFHQVALLEGAISESTVLAQEAGKVEPIQLAAVAVVRERDEELSLEWLLEGGICELEPGQILIVADSDDITDDEGSGEVYTSPPAPVSVVIDERAAFDAWTVKHGRVVGYNGWRNDFEVWQARACLDKVKELNQ